MKYTLTSSHRTQKKPFDFSAATEALVASYDRLSSTYDDLVASEAMVDEASQVMEDVSTAVASIKRFGVSVENMSLLNSNNALDNALGFEHLNVASIESLSNSTKELLKDKYVAALEENKEGIWARFVQYLKDLWEKIKRWFRELFDSNAKYVRIIQERIGEFSKIDPDSDKQIKALTAKQAGDCLAAASELISKVNAYLEICKNKEAANTLFPIPDKNKLEAVGITADQDGKLNTSGLADKLAKETKTYKDLGWTRDSKVPEEFTKVCVGQNIRSIATSFDAAFKIMLDEANLNKNAATDDAGKKAADEKIQTLTGARKNAVAHATSYIAVYKRLVDAVGTSLMAVLSLPKAQVNKVDKK